MDNKYQKGKIYTIRNYNDETLIYIGSTIDSLAQRIAKHRYDSKKDNRLLYKTVNNNWKEWYIELYELWPCNSKEELTRQEGIRIREIGNLNKIITGRTQKEYYEDNKKQITEMNKINYQNNKEQYTKKKKINYQNNKEHILEKHKKYYEDNKEKIKENRNIKVKCEYCGFDSNYSNLTRHQTSKKCQSHQIKK